MILDINKAELASIVKKHIESLFNGVSVSVDENTIPDDIEVTVRTGDDRILTPEEARQWIRRICAEIEKVPGYDARRRTVPPRRN